jgi:hypothetical protein
MHGAKAASHECSGAAGDGHEEYGVQAVRRHGEGTAQPLRQNRLQLVLAMALEREERLRQLFTVNSGGHHREDDAAVDFHERRGLPLGPEGSAGQSPNLTFTGHAKAPVLSAAADAVHRNGKGQKLGPRSGQLVSHFQDARPVLAPVLRG